MAKNTLVDSLFSFIERSPTAFHAVSQIRTGLERHNFIKLNEGEPWQLEKGKRYYVIRGGALIAFSLGSETNLKNGIRIIGTHTDSPSLQIKPNTRSDTGPYLLTGVEKYGGALLSTWFDRDLSLAGRVVVSDKKNSTRVLLIDFDKPVLYIPSLALHLNRKANDGLEINVQNDVSPVLSQLLNDQSANLDEIISAQLKLQYPEITVKAIHGLELFCYDTNKPKFLGLNNEFIAAPRLDNLLSCFIGLESVIQTGQQTNSMLICTNHEEIGSRSNSGALGNFPTSLFGRLADNTEEKSICLHNSFLLSLDNAHATHPNFKNKSDPDHEVLLNQGPVIKFNANQRYATTALTSSLIRLIAIESGIATQDFVMRSDMPCGSTIGPITSAQLGIAAVDVGAPTWGMHSVRELTGSKDPEYLYRLACGFINRNSLPQFGE